MIAFTGLWLIGGVLLSRSALDYWPTSVGVVLFRLNCAMLIVFVVLIFWPHSI